MRLIDADALIKIFEVLRDEHETHSISYNALYEVLVQQPTAYSVDKVVEELGQKKEEVQRMRNTCVALSDLEVCDIENVTYERAIEIVKQGVVSDDVCEWRIVDRPHNLPIYNTSCGKIRLQYVTGVDIYCNGCGKKIKVVGD